MKGSFAEQAAAAAAAATSRRGRRDVGRRPAASSVPAVRTILRGRGRVLLRVGGPIAVGVGRRRGKDGRQSAAA